MAADLSIFIILVFACCFLFSSGESRKELRTPEANKENDIQLGHRIPYNRIDPSRVTELSWQPRVFLYRGFLSDVECDHLISLGHENKEKPSRDISDLEGEKDEVTARIEEKISTWTFLPKGNGKPFQILHLEPEEAKQNYSYFSNKSSLSLGEAVTATLILYLSNVSQGGQILFPETESGSSQPKNKVWSDCTKSSDDILRPRKGNAILLFDLHPNTTLDRSSTHARCPVLEGEMWYATKHFVVKPVVGDKAVSETDDDGCTDEDESCPRWAAIGECERNPVFMVGSEDYYGTCRKSCHSC